MYYVCKVNAYIILFLLMSYVVHVFADDVFSHHFYGYNNYQHSYTHNTMQLL